MSTPLSSFPYAKPAAEVLQELHVQAEQGLSSGEVQRRRSASGLNELPTQSRFSLLALFAERFYDFLVLLLLAAAAISLYLGHVGDAIVIGAAILVDVFLSFLQSWRTEHTLSRMREQVKDIIHVRRNGRLSPLPARELVVGDIIEIRAGRHVPADARLLACRNLTTQEAILTGESSDVSKSAGPVPERATITSRHNMLFAGTSVVNGSGQAVVTAIGAQTEFGRMAGALRSQASPASPLRRSLQRTGLVLGAIVIGFVLLLAAASVIVGHPFAQTVRTSITLIVSAIPEDLTMILTIALTVGVVRIARKGGVVRQLASAEGLGAATVICADKTGTLTVGVMEAERFDFLQGEVMLPGQKMGDTASELALQGLALANDAWMDAAQKPNEEPRYFGSATERCALQFVEAAGISQRQLKTSWRINSTIHFSSQWKYRAVVAAHPTQSSKYLFVVGAPEVLLSASSQAVGDLKDFVALTAPRRAELLGEFDRLGTTGARLLAVAVKRHVSSPHITKRDVQGLTFLGVLLIRDPVRPEVASSIAQVMGAGVAVKMITGDHSSTARGVALAVGIPATSEHICTGEQLGMLNDEELSALMPRITVFARIEPLDKQRIVRILQRQGHIVAMTGDGVNDAVALKGADIGVAMGSGSDIAKDASDLVLLNNSFATIVAAIREGRVLRDNVRKVMAYLLATNMAEVAIFFISLLLGLPLPLLPAQILWINLVTDGTSDIALSLEGAEEDVMRRPPENPKNLLLGKHMSSHIIYSGLLMTAVTMILFWYLLVYQGQDLIYARTMAFAFLATSSLLSVWSFRSPTQLLFKGLLRNGWIIVSAAFSFALQLVAIYAPPVQDFFGTVALSQQDWLVIIVLGVITTLLLDARKLLSNKRRLSIA
jgi:P-type Ca2+ transporter type 2C